MKPYRMSLMKMLTAGIAVALAIHAPAGIAADAEEKVERLARKTGAGIRHGAEKTREGIETGARHAGRGIERAAAATAKGVRKGVEKTGEGIEKLGSKLRGKPGNGARDS